LGQIELGSLRGQDERGSLEYRMPFSSPAAGEWRLTLLLREWTERGYQTRDYCNFPVPYRAEPRLAIKAPKRVSVSEASVEELAAVDGLNVKLAQAIVRARPFASLKDLMRVRGIGEKMLQKLRAQLTV
jgi:competence ComEA-like helix-hairpin-helix protein